MKLSHLLITTIAGVLLVFMGVIFYELWGRVDFLQSRIAQLETKFETEARPLIIVDKYSSVYLEALKVKPENEENKGTGRRAQGAKGMK